MRILYYISFKYVFFLFCFLRCLRNLKKWSCFEKIGENGQKWGKIAAPESPIIHYFRPSVCLSVNNFFKNLLLQNQKANLDKTWQECSLDEALQKLLTEFNSNKNSGCHGNKMAENGKNL